MKNKYKNLREVIDSCTLALNNSESEIKGI